ncbi:MAG: hypothetical protein LQ340_005289, partial [Diploschistes diacapsis]
GKARAKGKEKEETVKSKTPIKGFGPEEAFDEGESFVDVCADQGADGYGDAGGNGRNGAVNLDLDPDPDPDLDVSSSVASASLGGDADADADADVDWRGGMGFSPVKFDAGEWTTRNGF